MIKDAQLEDISSLLPFCEECFYDAKLDDEGNIFDSDSVKSLLVRMINDNDSCMVVKYEENDQIVGLIAAMIVFSPININQKQVIEVMWHGKPTLGAFKKGKVMIKLLKQIEAFAIDKAINRIMICASNDNDISRYLERNSYHKATTNYLKGI